MINNSEINDNISVSIRNEYEKTQIDNILKNLENELIGLKPVKKRIREIAALLLIDKLRKNVGLTAGNPGLHVLHREPWNR